MNSIDAFKYRILPSFKADASFSCTFQRQVARPSKMLQKRQVLLGEDLIDTTKVEMTTSLPIDCAILPGMNLIIMVRIIHVLSASQFYVFLPGHRPGPQQSFCVIREPVDKLLSEYNFRTNVQDCHTDHLQSWVANKLKLAESRRHMDDCHLLPSQDFAHSCDFPIPYDSHHDGVGMLLRVRFNISLEFAIVHPMWKKRCSMKMANLSAESIDRIREFYAKDFLAFLNARKNYGKIIKEGLVSPQIPDMCPKSQLCKQGDKCLYSGCKVPWLDEPIAANYPCIHVGCNPNDKNHLRIGGPS